MELNHSYQTIFSVVEIDCESNGNLDYFELDFNKFLDNIRNACRSSVKYEIILNGNSVKFSEENFKYNIINDRIIIEGYLDRNDDETKYIAYAKKSYNEEFKLKSSKSK